MNLQRTRNTPVIALALLAIAILLITTVADSRNAQASIYNGTAIAAATTTVSLSITNSARILATTTELGIAGTTRVYATICNPNANPVYLLLNNDAPAQSGAYTMVIAAAAGYTACYEITDRNMYQGSITASSTNQTATTIFASQYVQ